jgi:hypothetical protein
MRDSAPDGYPWPNTVAKDWGRWGRLGVLFLAESFQSVFHALGRPGEVVYMLLKLLIGPLFELSHHLSRRQLRLAAAAFAPESA